MNDPSVRYSLADVAKYNGKNGTKIWIVINDYVYDVTNYLHRHPGGADLLEEYAGRDATNEFDEFGHSSDARKIMKEFLIGELEDEDKRANRKKKQVSSGAIAGETYKQKRRGFLAVLCGKCTS
ncbi:PREDICTED: cytochrome b5-like [Dinoponera quadriceps]|uniref:Cytochrome b5-like n=1 Tax=Dinoponera quadriceps TaxID=609295 RepID=A0A6P3YFB3_DINQU|nr:PREDICTED: cytochrome b5-like [Dinoponera quadriceps]